MSRPDDTAATAALAQLVARADLDELVREIDRMCARRDWDGLVELAERCSRAVATGRQLWPAAHHAEYRLALEAPGPYAGAVLREGTGRFTLGPLAEVAASTHTWAELAAAAPPGPVRSLAAHERVVRGEDLSAERVTPAVLDVPLRLAAWEPRYALAEYEPHRASFPAPPAPPPDRPVPAAAADALAPDEGVAALAELVRPWTDESDGRSAAAVVRGTAAGAIAALGVGSARWTPVEPGTAVAAMAWAGASGGARGRRRGAAAGRFGAWWAVAALGGIVGDDDDGDDRADGAGEDAGPLDADDVGDAAAALRWYRWDDGAPATGWELRLAVEDPDHGLAWAIAATDAG